MACRCRKSDRKSIAEKEKLLSIKKVDKISVSFKVLQEHKSICMGCKYATKEYRNNIKTLVPISKCVISGKLLIRVLKDPKYACPKGKFPSQH